MKDRFTATSATAVFEVTEKHRDSRSEWRWSWVNRLLNSKLLSRCQLMQYRVVRFPPSGLKERVIYPVATLCHRGLSFCHIVPRTDVLLPRCTTAVKLPPSATNSCLVATLCSKPSSCCHIVPRTVVLLPLCATNSCFVATLRNGCPVADLCHKQLSCCHLMPHWANSPVATWWHNKRVMLSSYGERVIRVMRVV